MSDFINKYTDKSLKFFFNLLFFLIPLIVVPFTSELFEFNKIIFVYLLTTLIISIWAIKSICHKRIIFRRTILDFPILFFLIGQMVSVFISVDIHSSIFGYYSRFNGGILSSLAYSLLYWAYVSNFGNYQAKKSLSLIVYSSILVSIYGILERFGVDKNLWVQDVQNRVFSTLGQPNWLAAWLVAIIPITLILGKTIIKNNKNKLTQILPIMLFITLLFTKSRSGLIAFMLSDLVFFLTLIVFGIKTKFKKEIFKLSLYWHLMIVIIVLIIGTPWSSGIIYNRQGKSTPTNQNTTIPALEEGGTSSVEIRKYVWRLH